MSVRARFALTVVVIVTITVTLFASVSIVAIDRTLRSTFRSRLLTTAQAISSATDFHHHQISIDAHDLLQISPVRSGTPFAVIRTDGTQVAGAPVPAGAARKNVEVASAAIVRAGALQGHAMVWQSADWIGEFDRIATLVSLIVGVLLVALGYVLSRRAADTALAPLQAIAGLAERIEGRDLSLRLRSTGDDELGRLCASFDRMLDRLEAAFARERRFVGDASHELRAPLAVLRAETELALRRERSTLEYRTALLSIAHEAGRLEELVDELLAAARAEVDARDLQALDIGALARQVGERVKPAAAVRGVLVDVDVDEEPWALADRTTLERALLAVVHNAIAFAREDGHVGLRVARASDHVEIEVIDDGPGFSSEGLAHATERFWRGDSARSRGGTGLGLAIARTIVEANGGSLELDNRHEGGASVRIALASP